MFDRRTLLQSGLSFFGSYAFTTAFAAKVRKNEWSTNGKLITTHADRAHLLRANINHTPTSTRKIETLIIGGGISGLSAGWWLQKKGLNDFLIVDLDQDVGGNSQSSKNHISPFPWGAHYLPIPSSTSLYVKDFLRDVGVIKGMDQDGLDIYNPEYLCADRQERLFFKGSWQDSLIPQKYLTQDELQQFANFHSYIEIWKNKIGRDHKPAFAIPVAFSSQDPEFLELDNISFATLATSQGWTSKPLDWYLNYCCKDDYGRGIHEVSAWSGIHYFAARSGIGSNTESHSVLTWPEGNGWLVQQFEKILTGKIERSKLAIHINTKSHQLFADILSFKDGSVERVYATDIIYAGHRLSAANVIDQYKESRPAFLQNMEYAPWLVANVSIEGLSEDEREDQAWDNVNYYQESLGYIVADHQNITTRHHANTVLTYFKTLDSFDPKTSRLEAGLKSHQDWSEMIRQDLAKTQPRIAEKITNIDCKVWGHGMIYPKVGYIWGKDRNKRFESLGRLHFAHSDMSGISIFEEAQYQGVEAANKVIQLQASSHHRSAANTPENNVY
ncbi:MAG: NAD(P)/FAD-dependent oxidoreductase [Proteobacteria bacterium]|nr:NAD(P)/FAD-dependent oxidoreductase [Pseudomonadota bacterium]